MVSNTLQRDYDIARIIDDYERRIAYLERQTLKLQPLITDSGWVSVPAAAGFTSSLEVRLVGGRTQFRGTLLPNTDWGVANSLQQPVAAGGVPAAFRPPISLIYITASGATVATTVFRTAIQSNGGIQVRCSTGGSTNSVSVNETFLDD